MDTHLIDRKHAIKCGTETVAVSNLSEDNYPGESKTYENEEQTSGNDLERREGAALNSKSARRYENEEEGEANDIS